MGRMDRVRVPLVLTGGPAVGKSTTARLLARSGRRAAVVDVDDVRLMVVAGHAAPWQGPEGRAQQLLGIENGCALARRFGQAGFEVVVSDVLTPETEPLYRELLPGCRIVRLLVTAVEARRRAATRAVHLTDAEFDDLHLQDRVHPPAADHHLDVTLLTLVEQAAAVADLWALPVP